MTDDKLDRELEDIAEQCAAAEGMAGNMPLRRGILDALRRAAALGAEGALEACEGDVEGLIREDEHASASDALETIRALADEIRALKGQTR